MLTYHYILSYIYNTFIVRYNKRRIYFENAYKTDLCDCLKINAKGTHLYSRWASDSDEETLEDSRCHNFYWPQDMIF